MVSKQVTENVRLPAGPPFPLIVKSPHHIVGHEARVGGVLRKASIQVGLHLRRGGYS